MLVTWPKKYIYSQNEICLQKNETKISPSPTAPTRGAKATVKSMHMTRRRSVSPKLFARALLIELKQYNYVFVRACVRASLRVVMYVSVLFVFLLYVTFHVLR